MGKYSNYIKINQNENIVDDHNQISNSVNDDFYKDCYFVLLFTGSILSISFIIGYIVYNS
jgi:hypothetical protein